ncbi:MAG: hypothetical protein LBL62_01340 [Planctomycetaceae bacterium]|jgi:hypothetical protein|nr:hypothetical protein [Planctomycetaceae bacterium]
MYSEFAEFCKQVVPQKAYWKDGELWTALIGGVGSFIWFQCDGEVIGLIRQNFGDLLNIVGIIFGFVLAALVFYIEAASNWADKDNVQKVADMIIDRHVWTVLCLLLLIGVILLVWVLGRYVSRIDWLNCLLHSFLVFGFLYCGFQVFNHVLTVWWHFRNRKRFRDENR